MRIINYKNIPYAEVARIIRKLMERGVELDQITMRVYEYVSKFTKCERASELVNILTSMRLKEITAVIIANILPRSIDELRALMNFEDEIPSEDKLNEILSKINEVCPQE
ncbi:MAG: hypothetical protein B6U85_00175 [Desulfurococcales archaeon ex4484_42]|nr:MAG: hypothetical protein B6U85_00175 [Desulfurococcales archaeon ex4484_42]